MLALMLLSNNANSCGFERKLRKISTFQIWINTCRSAYIPQEITEQIVLANEPLSDSDTAQDALPISHARRKCFFQLHNTENAGHSYPASTGSSCLISITLAACTFLWCKEESPAKISPPVSIALLSRCSNTLKDRLMGVPRYCRGDHNKDGFS